MSANNISGAVNTNNITYKNTTSTKPAPAPQETPKKETDNSKKLLLALGGLAAIGVAAYLITHGKKDKVKDIAEDTLPQAANNAQNTGKASDTLKEGVKNTTKKTASKKSSVKKTSKAAGKNAPTNKPAIPTPQPELSAAEKMKNFTGEKAITKKDGTKVVAKFEKGKPTESIFTHPDGKVTAKVYDYEDGKLKTVKIFSAKDKDSLTLGNPNKRIEFTPNKGHTIYEQTFVGEQKTSLKVKTDEYIPYGADISVTDYGGNVNNTIIKYFKKDAPQKHIVTETISPTKSMEKFPITRKTRKYGIWNGKEKFNHVSTKDETTGKITKKLVYNNGYTDTLISGRSFDSADLEICAKNPAGEITGYYKRESLKADTDKSDKWTTKIINKVKEIFFDEEHKEISSNIGSYEELINNML